MIVEPPVRPVDAEPSPPVAIPTGGAPGNGGAAPPDGDAEPTVSLRRACLAALLSAAAAAWMLGGVFDSPLARPLALACAALGVGAAAAAARTRRPGVIGLLLVPVAFVAASLVSVATDSRVSPLEAVQSAVSSGGLLQPPVPFDAGWRFVLVALCVLLAAATATLVLNTGRPRLALALPLPVVLAGALLQPPDGGVLGAGVSLVLVIAGLMVMYAAEMGGAGGGRGFELRRSLRGAGALAVALVALVLLNRSSFLFPAAVATRAIPPQKPQVQPLDQVKDRVIARVKGPGDLSGPWRLGELDSYDGSDFLLPPYDPARLQNVAGDQPLTQLKGATQDYTVTVVDPEQRVLPAPAGATRVNLQGGHAQYDPRSGVLLLPAAPTGAVTYTVSGEKPPSAQDLSAAGPARGVNPDDTWVPAAPAEVQRLLDGAPRNPWDRLQALRQALYDHVVAAGPGVPGPTPPSRVVAMLAGGKASPYEIAAAQVLLARWAGLPARLGYGFYGGDQVAGGGGVELRPRHGANWAEVYFEGYGWVPVIGVPAHAVSPLDANPANHSPQIHPAQEVSLQLYVPTDASTALLLYQVIRWWLAVLAPIALGVAALAMFFPWPLKVWRARRRRRQARALGPAAEIAADYAGFRDLANDLRAGDPWCTPLEFLDRLSLDEEHEEYAWLVTRALWGDLARDLRAEDVEAAREMGASLRRRLSRGQPWLTRALALSSRASLREPYDRTLFNPWPAPAARGAGGRRRVRVLRRRYA
jgi:hypothetical protein